MKIFQIGCRLPLLIACVLFAAAADQSLAQTEDPSATVRSVQGAPTMSGGLDQNLPPLAVGLTLRAWEVARTNQADKIYLQLNTGPGLAVGEYSSFFLSSKQDPSGTVAEIQITEGSLRFAGMPGPQPYSVVTPIASISPEDPSVPFDFVVEAPTPTTTVVTVLDGRVRVENLSVNGVSQSISSCRVAYLEDGKTTIDVGSAPADDVSRLIALTTIPGTMPENTEACQAVAAGPPPPGPAYAPPPMPRIL